MNEFVDLLGSGLPLPPGAEAEFAAEMRAFFIRRHFLVQTGPPDCKVSTLEASYWVLPQKQYDELKAGTLKLSSLEAAYWRGFIDGWKRAKA